MPEASTQLQPQSRIVVDALTAAVLRTLAYADIFDFPLTLPEMHRYLVGVAADPAAIEAALARLDGRVAARSDQYALRGREALFERRAQRAAHAARLWPAAVRYGRLIAALPFVRMVAVTGALAADNVETDADLDYLIVTAPGWLWLCRAMILGLDRVARLAGNRSELCPNYLVTTQHLSLPETDLFSAQELCRMVPLSGLDVYAQMRAANAWSASWLPNASGAPRDLVALKDRGLQRAAEFVLGLLPLGWLERWEMRRKIAKFSNQGMNAETRFSADYCKGHFDGHKQRTMAAFAARLEALGLPQP
jgi:hypothetical protein